MRFEYAFASGQRLLTAGFHTAVFHDRLAREHSQRLRLARQRDVCPGGLLSKAKNFEYRPEQQQMAVAVARALEDGAHQVVEAGTGVGNRSRT